MRVVEFTSPRLVLPPGTTIFATFEEGKEWYVEREPATPYTVYGTFPLLTGGMFRILPAANIYYVLNATNDEDAVEKLTATANFTSGRVMASITPVQFLDLNKVRVKRLDFVGATSNVQTFLVYSEGGWGLFS